MKNKFFAFGMTLLFSSHITQAAVVHVEEEAFLGSIGGTSPSVVNFDVDTNGSPIATNEQIDQQYLPFGVDFNPFNGGVPIASDLFPLTSPNNLQTVPDTRGGGGFETVLTNPVTGVGFQVGDLQGPSFGSTVLEIFDSNDNSLGSFNLFDEVGDGTLTYLFFGITSDIPISKMQVSVGTDDYVTFDEFRLQPVPIPAALPLFLSAVVTIGFLGRNSKKA